MDLYERLKSLGDSELDEVMHFAGMPAEHRPHGTRAQRALRFADWAAQGPDNRARVERALAKVAPALASIGDELHGAARRPEPEGWELAYLRNRLPAWQEGRKHPSAGADGSRGDQWLSRDRAYVSLRAEAFPWLYRDESGAVVVLPPTPRGSDLVQAAAGRQSVEHGTAREAGVLLEEAISHSDLPFAVVMADGGFGKSVLLEHVAYVLAATHLKALPADYAHSLDLRALAHGAPLLRIPVLVDAVKVAEAVAAVGAEAAMVEVLRLAFATRHAQADVARDDIAARLDAGRYLILVDALDEVPSGPRQEGPRTASPRDVALCFAGLALSRPRCRGVLTTRPDARVSLPGDLRVVPIAPLGPDEVAAMKERWCGARSYDEELRRGLDAALEGLEEMGGAESMLEKPLLVACLFLVYQKERSLPRRAATLYGAMVRLLCKPREGGTLGEDRQREALQRVMRFLQEQGGTEAPEHLVADELMQWQGLASSTEAKALLSDELAARTGIVCLVQSQSGAWVVRPWHRTFQEFLAAWDLAAEHGQHVARRLIDEGRILDPAWQGVLRFLPGTLLEHRSTFASAYLVDLTKAAEGQGLREGHVLGLVAAALAEYPELARYKRSPVGPVALADVASHLARRFEAAGHDWPWRDRVSALDALGSMEGGDPRLTPSNRWVEVPPGIADVGGDREVYYYLPRTQRAVGGFKIARWPVTAGEYGQFLRESPGYGPPPDWRQQQRHLNRPVVEVSWHDARAFCHWASGAWGVGLVTLPTETEWEYVARGPDRKIYPWGDREPGAGDGAQASYAWDGEASPNSPTPVGGFPGGHFRIGTDSVWDMAGNVLEWCRSRWERPEGQPDVWTIECQEGDNDEGQSGKARHHGDKADPQGGTAAPRVFRGGSWLDPAGGLRAAYRYRHLPRDRNGLLGFRVVCRGFPGS